MIRVGIYGGAGYTAGDLIRLLVHHPEVRLEWVHSNSQAGKPITAVHEGLLGDTDLCFSETCDLNSIDYLFLCQGLWLLLFQGPVFFGKTDSGNMVPVLYAAGISTL